ncbi:hypothetical protein WA158_000763 [Blastocystis sp. Blastoise]
MDSTAKLLFIGTGTSEGIPVLSCLLGDCPVCHSAMEPGSKNHRRNISNNIRNIDGVLITHEHEDAMGGIDNLRDITRRILKGPLGIYTTNRVKPHLERVYPYIFKNEIDTIHGTLPELYIHTINLNESFSIKDILIEAFSVPHGDIPCTAFRIGSLCYISDCSSITNEMLQYINGSRILIIDCQYQDQTHHSTHISMFHLNDYLKNHFYVPIPPKHIYFVGMCHRVDHDSFNQQLIHDGYENAQCAYDGQVIEFSLKYIANKHHNMVKLSDMDSKDEIKPRKHNSFLEQTFGAKIISFTPNCIIALFFSLFAVFLVFGISITVLTMNNYEKVIPYDGEDVISDCQISKNNEDKICRITFDIDQELKSPVYIYYELDHFYQNHRQYMESRSHSQLQGLQKDNNTYERECKQKVRNEMTQQILWPCGLAANSLFNDVYSLENSTLTWSEKDISLPIDRKLYKNPSFYGDSNYQWIYQTYPMSIHKDQESDPLSSATYGGGVLDEHFVVWMKLSAYSSFRKINVNIYKNLTRGMATANYVCAAISLIVALFFLIVNIFYPHTFRTPMTKIE